MSEGVRHTLPKTERISGRTTISALMRSGRYISAAPLRCCCLRRGDDGACRLLVSVPKRLYKRAVKRNLLKRRIRESFRLQKHRLPAGYDLMFVYTSAEIHPFADIYAAVGTVIASLSGHGED